MQAEIGVPRRERILGEIEALLRENAVRWTWSLRDPGPGTGRGLAVRVALVSREVYPLAGGGIGAFVSAAARLLSRIAEVTIVTTSVFQPLYERSARRAGSAASARRGAHRVRARAGAEDDGRLVRRGAVLRRSVSWSGCASCIPTAVPR